MFKNPLESKQPNFDEYFKSYWINASDVLQILIEYLFNKKYVDSDMTKAYMLGAVFSCQQSDLSRKNYLKIVENNKRLSTKPYQDMMIEYLNLNAHDLYAISNCQMLYQYGYRFDETRLAEVLCPFFKLYLKCGENALEIRNAIEYVLNKYRDQRADIDILKKHFYKEYKRLRLGYLDDVELFDLATACAPRSSSVILIAAKDLLWKVKEDSLASPQSDKRGTQNDKVALKNG